jgi:hypothetical protein
MLYTEHAKTDDERRKALIATKSFTELWNTLWGEAGLSSYYKSEENLAREKFNILKNGSSLTNPATTHLFGDEQP